VPNEPALEESIEQILTLRRAERTAAADVRPVLLGAREFLEALIGPTVRPATAARVLGISQPALRRWLDKGDVISLVGPDGHRQVPLEELISLLEDVDRLGVQDAPRPIAAVLRDRKTSATSIDIDRLLPRRVPHGHRAAERQSLAYHRLVAGRLDGDLAEEARRRLARWRVSGRIHERWADEWERVMALPLPQIAKAISADTPRARELRQTSPFAGVLPERERKQLVEAVARRA